MTCDPHHPGGSFGTNKGLVLVGDLEEINGFFETLREAVVNQRSCWWCIELQEQPPNDHYLNHEKVFAILLGGGSETWPSYAMIA